MVPNVFRGRVNLPPKSAAKGVGYSGTSNGGAKAPIIGGQFFDIAGGASFDLTKFSIPGTKIWEEVDTDEWEWTCDFVVPGSEFIRVLDTSSLVDNYQYTYISAEYLLKSLGKVSQEDWEPTIEKYKWAIGWWKYVKGYDYKTNIKNHTEGDMMIKEPLTFPNGTAFIGNFANKKTRNLVSNGEVKCQTFAISNAGAKAPVVANQHPVDIDLTDMSIPGTKVWEEVDTDEWEWTCDFVVPGSEFIRLLDTSSLVDDGQYTYISAEYLLKSLGKVSQEDWEPTIAKYTWAIGWWKYVKGYDYKTNIKNHTEGDMMVKKGDVSVPAGTGFIGNFANKKTRQINFPSAIDVPSKK